MNSQLSRKIEKLQDKAYRDAYVRAHVSVGIPHQIRALREQRGWSQAELGRRSGKPANVINRLENPESGGNTIRTCLEMASAFDVALLVKFVPYSRFLKEFEDVSPQGLEVPSFCNDPYLPVAYEPSQVFPAYAYLPRIEEGAIRNFTFNLSPDLCVSSPAVVMIQDIILTGNIIRFEGATHAKEPDASIPPYQNACPSFANPGPPRAGPDRDSGQRVPGD